MNSTLAALRLVDADEWHHPFTDGTSRRQIAFQNFVIAVMVDSKLDTVIVSSCVPGGLDVQKSGQFHCDPVKIGYEYVTSKHFPLILTKCSLLSILS